MQKLYCYVDETGQDAGSTCFLVSVIMVEDERTELVKTLERIERESGKGKVKWIGAKDDTRAAYIRQVLANAHFRGKLWYAVYPSGPDYFTKTLLTTARAITAYVSHDNYRATVLIDGLPKTLVHRAGAVLRRLHIRTFKVRGIRKEEHDALMRLADALCGFVRSAREGRTAFANLLETAKKHDFIREL